MGWLGGRGKGERNHTHRLKGCGDAGGRERRGERARRRRRDAWPLSTAAVETSRSPPTKTRADAPARAQTSACGHLSCERGPGAPSLSTRTSEDDERGHEFHCFWPGADGHSRGGGEDDVRARTHTAHAERARGRRWERNYGRGGEWWAQDFWRGRECGSVQRRRGWLVATEEGVRWVVVRKG